MFESKERQKKKKELETCREIQLVVGRIVLMASTLGGSVCRSYTFTIIWFIAYIAICTYHL